MQSRQGGAAILFMPTTAGVVAAVDGVEEASALPGVVDVTLVVNPGDAVPEARNNHDRSGAVVAIGFDAQEALMHAQAAVDSIHVRLK